MKILYAFTICSFLVVTGYAQTNIRGRVVSASAEGVPGVNVLLLARQDSAMVKGDLSDAQGAFNLVNVRTGAYLLKISFIGMKTIYKPLEISSGAVDMGAITLEADATELAEVVVQAQKPMFEQLTDRLVVNVQSNITSAGNSALDLLERSPGVSLDRGSKSMALNGKEEVVVMLNGKPTRMAMSSLFDMLAGMNAANIEKIELISNPPARYEASGNAIVNIQMIKNPDVGTNGSVTLNAGYGQREKANVSFNINHRGKKTNLYNDLSYTWDHQKETFINDRRVFDPENEVVSRIVTRRDPIGKNLNGRIGLDYQLSPKTLIGTFVQGSYNIWDMHAKNSSTIRDNTGETQIEVDNHELGKLRTLMTNVNVSHKLSSTSELNVDVDYLYYGDKNNTTYHNDYSFSGGDVETTEQLKTNKNTPKDIWVSRLDFAKSVSPKTKFETGATIAYSRLTNDVFVGQLIDDAYEPLDMYNENSALDEKIAGVYVSFNNTLSERIKISGGLRYEYSKTDLDVTSSDKNVRLEYNNLFPTFFISHKLGKESSVQFSYGRRISRPSFNDLAPFFIFLDPNTYFYGNTSLTPSVSSNVKGDFLYQNLIWSVEYNNQDNAIVRYQPVVIKETNQQAFTSLNLDYRRSIITTITLPVTFTPWASLNISLLGIHREIKQKDKERMTKNFYRISWTQKFKLPRDFAFEVSGFYQSESLGGVAGTGDYYSINAGLQKKINERSKISATINNMFGYEYDVFVARTDDNDYATNTNYSFEPWIVRLSYTVRFGDAKVKDKRNRTTGSEPLKERAN